MKFKDFIESMDLEDMSDIEFEDEFDSFNGFKYVYNFEVDNIKYRIIFSKVYLHGLENAYDIAFKGPANFQVTDLKNQFKVYPKILSIIKTFIEKYRPEGLHFYGFINDMDLVYKKFADRFFKDEPGKPSNQIYIRIDEKDWIRKDAYENLDSVTKQDVDKAINSWSKREKDFFDEIRQKKNERRNLVINIKKSIGGFAFDGHQYGLIIDVKDAYIITIVIRGEALRFDDYSFYLYSRPQIIPPSQASPEIFKKFANLIDLPVNQTVVNRIPSDILQKLRTYQTANNL